MSDSESSSDEESEFGLPSNIRDEPIGPLKLPSPTSKQHEDEDAYGLLTIGRTGSIEDPDDDYDLIAVHGLHGDRESTWRAAASGGEASTDQQYGLQSVIETGARFLTFGYDTATAVRADGIESIAVSLLEALYRARLEETSASRPLGFAAQDIGGTIVKEALRIAALRPEYHHIRDSIQLILFFDCPHRYQDEVDLQDQIARLYLMSAPKPKAVVEGIQQLAASVVRVNTAFENATLPLHLRMTSIYSTTEEPFDTFTSTISDAHILLDTQAISSPKSHSEICKVPTEDKLESSLRDVVRRNLRNEVLEKAVFETARMLSAPMSNLWPLRGPTLSEVHISEHAEYKHWLHGTGPSILHVQSSDADSRMQAAKELFFRMEELKRHEKTDAILLAFSFDKNNDDCNNLIAMLSSFLSKLFTVNRNCFRACRSLRKQTVCFRSWTLSELLVLLEDALQYWDPNPGVYFVIDNLGESNMPHEAAKWLSDMCSNNERSYKFAVTSAQEEGLQETFLNCQTILLNNGDAGNGPVENGDLIASEGHAGAGGELLGTSKILHSQNVHNPEQWLMGCLSRVPENRQDWVRTALTWMALSFRPLTIWELSSALYLDLRSTTVSIELSTKETRRHLDQSFPGIFKLHEQTVYSILPNTWEAVRKIKGSGQFPWLGALDTAHEDIGTLCLRSISDFVSDHPDALPQHGLVDLFSALRTHDSKHALCDYAIRFWPRHMSAAADSQSRLVAARAFFVDPKLRRFWSLARWHLAAPLVRPDRSFVNWLPLAASARLDWLVQDELSQSVETGLQRTTVDYELLLTEVVRTGQTALARQVSRYVSKNMQLLQIICQAAASSGEETTMDWTTQFISELPEQFDWPPEMLFRSAQFGFYEISERLLHYGAPVDAAPAGIEVSPLYVALRYGHSSTAKLLLSHGADFAKRSVFGRLPIHEAVIGGHQDAFKVVLEATEDVAVSDERDLDAMAYICDYGSFKLAPMLLDAGYKIDLAVTGSWGPLARAVANGFEKTIRVLLDKGADPNSDQLTTPLLHRAVYAKRLDAMTVLLDAGAPVDARNSSEQTALLLTSRSGSEKFVKILIEKGATLDCIDDEGWTPLMWAAENGHTSVVESLLKAGADANKATEDVGVTPLHVVDNKSDIPRLLIEHGADPNAGLKVSGATPLMSMAYVNHVEAVKAMLENGADPGAKSGDIGITALAVAVAYESIECLRLFLDAGADVQEMSEENQNLLHVAVETGNEDVVRLLLEHNTAFDAVEDKYGDTPLLSVKRRTPVGIVKRLLQRGADPEVRNKDGRTVLCEASLVGNIEVVLHLIGRGVELDVRTISGAGPLHFSDTVEIARALVEAGADVNMVDPVAGTPLTYICYGVESDDTIPRYLLETDGVDVDIEAGRAGCALNAACGFKDPETVELILAKTEKVNCADSMGRRAIHFAAFANYKNYDLLRKAGCEMEVSDNMGRTVLHWATIGGNLDIMSAILASSSDLVNTSDLDGWTPLLWAARGSKVYGKANPLDTEEELQTRMMDLLLGYGADASIIGRGVDREWNSLEVGVYQGSDQSVLDMLREEVRLSRREENIVEGYVLQKVAIRTAERDCHSCFMDSVGCYYVCRDCDWFCLCFKCYRSKHLVHPKDHNFEKKGVEYAESDSGGHEDDDDNEGSEASDASSTQLE